jgi:cell division protein FtsW
MERLIAFTNPWKYANDQGFQTVQSLYALGSGGLFGVGLGRSMQKYFYLPEQHTDFIFAILGEELGFIGVTLVLGLFLLFAWRGFKIAINAPDNFSRILASGVTIMIIFQAIINIGVVSGSLPVTGITLPFVSYGGTSLLFSMMGVGLLLNISRYSTNK